MEPVASTYGSRSLTSFTADYYGSIQPASPSSGLSLPVSASDAADRRTDGIKSVNSDEQKGIQPSNIPAEEFKPYSRTSAKSEGDKGSDVAVVDASGKKAANTTGVANKEQDPQLQAAVAQMKSTEEKVKAHEAAHKAAGGAMTGPVSYSYTRGPDGRNYITGGEVPISVSPGKTPQETISRMQQVIQAALAPSDPSPQDRAVAAQAAAQQQEAQQQQAQASAGLSDVASGKSGSSGTSTTEAKSDSQKPGQSTPGDLPDITSARDARRAYADPAVTSKTGDSLDGIVPRQIPRFEAAVSEGGQTSDSAMTSLGINGSEASSSLSYYA